MTEKKDFLLGCSDFEKLNEENQLFIDKTMFIKEFMNENSEVSCILRPRRFGKSFNLSMLKSFLSLGAKPESFENYLIAKEVEFVKQHCGKYPVVYLDLKDCKGETWEEMYQNFWTLVREMLKPFLVDLVAQLAVANDPYALTFTQPYSSTTDKGYMYVRESLKWHLKTLKKLFSRRVIVLITN